MNWMEVRQAYPHQWLLVEAINAYSDSGKRVLDRLAVLGAFCDSIAAMQDYAELHREAPARELYVLHTDREALEILERTWLGIRGLR